MSGNDPHGLGDQTEALLFHDRGGDREGLPGADRVRDVGVARGNDAPNDAFLVLVEADDIAGAGQGQMAAVEVPRHQIVEPVVVDARQPVGAVRGRSTPSR